MVIIFAFPYLLLAEEPKVETPKTTTAVPADKNSTPSASSLSTPPTVVGEWDLDADFAKVFQQFDSIEAALTNEDYYNIKDEKVSKWGCGMQAGHSALVLQTIAREIGRNLEDPTRRQDEKPAQMMKMVFTKGIIPRGVGEAPLIVMPYNNRIEHWQKVYEDARLEWRALEMRKGEIRTCPARYKHFAFGALTSSDWVRFAGIHTAHHMKIIRDILIATGDSGRFGSELMDK